MLKKLPAKAVCPFCNHMVIVVSASATTMPWFEKHRAGRGADRRGGETPSTTCQGSLTAVPRNDVGRVAPAREISPEEHAAMDDINQTCIEC